MPNEESMHFSRSFLITDFKTVKSVTEILLPPSTSKSDLKLVCNVNIVYGNLKSENSPD